MSLAAYACLPARSRGRRQRLPVGGVAAADADAVADEPGPATTARMPSAQRRDQLLDVAENLFVTRGYSAMSWGVHGLTPNARVIERIDADAFAALIIGMLETPTHPSPAIAGL